MHARVEDVERRLTQLAAESPDPERVDGRIQADALVWLCACVTPDDAPIWLVYAFGSVGIGWCRVGEGQSREDLVNATAQRGDHTDPEIVWKWLDGGRRDPWLREESNRSTDEVMMGLTRKIRRLT